MSRVDEGGEPDTLLEEALEAWADARQGVIDELENLPEEGLEFRPAPGTRSVAELVRHIMEVSLMMVAELARSDTDLRRLPWPELIAPHAERMAGLTSREELVQALATTQEEGLRTLRAAGELHMLGPGVRFDGLTGTRLAWLHHGIAQEMYHRGQLALIARLLGREPALTRRIRGG